MSAESVVRTSPGTAARAPLPLWLQNRHRRILVYLDVIFGGYCLAMAIGALLAWRHGHGTLRTVAAVSAFACANGAISQVSRRVSRPVASEVARLIVGALIAPFAYLTTDAPFGMWWPGFMIMALGGAVSFGCFTGSPRAGRLVSIYYASLLFLTEQLGNSHPNWYAFSVGAGCIVMVGFLLSEIVAQLDRTLVAERKQTEALRIEKARAEELLQKEAIDRAFRAIVEGTAGATDEGFFRSLVEHLATALGVAHAFVAEIADDPPTRVRTAAFWSNGAIGENFEYALAGTPCEHVVGGDLCFYPAAVQRAFPSDVDLVTLAAESYLGMPLRDSAGRVLGHVAVLDSRPMHGDARHQEILAIFAARAGAEIERQRSQRALMALNAELEARVSERTAALQAALDESSLLSGVLQVTPDIVGIATMEGRALYLNRAGRQRLGLSPDEPAGNYDISAFYTEASLRTILDEGIPKAIEQGNWFGDLTMRDLGGNEIPVSLAGNVHFDASRAPKYISAIARDVSESKRVAAELQAAKETAEAASRSKSTFLATMSHEIRTPMNAVLGMTDLLLATELTARQREFVETIRAGGDALLTVINDVLDFSKIEAGRLELEQRAFNLRAALESVADLLAPRAAEKGLELALNIAQSVPEAVVGDEMRLRQILVNLVGNGIKFTQHGEVVISVDADAVQSDTTRTELRLSVRDTGIGIPPGRKHRLFSSFSQLDPSTTREYGGTGLGLAISKRLVELMEGAIWVESDGLPGHGSTFHFKIRLGLAAPIQPASARQVPPALAGRRVLVVDDNSTNRHILGLQLQAWGMLAIEAAHPAEALELLQRRDRFDLVMLDMQMPGMDGLTLARTICSQRGTRRLPMIMLTSVGRDVHAGAQSLECFAGHLTKPVKSSQLYDAIISAIVGQDHDKARAIAAVPAAGTLVRRRASAPLKILLAEDMEVNRKFALLALEELGFDAAVAVNGGEVLRAVSESGFDVILMDVQMPEMDGLEATRWIRRQLLPDRQPYIVAMTANAMRGDREICLEAGMDDYLSKPVYLSELRAALDRAVQRITLLRGSSRQIAPAAARAAMPEGTRVAGAQSLLGLYFGEADETLQRLREAFERGDRSGIRDAAHALKGTSGYMGAADVVRASAAIEQASRDGVVTMSMIVRLEDEVEGFRRQCPAEPHQLTTGEGS